MQLRLNIAIDDVCPKKGYRIIGEQTEIWLRKLNEEFGVRYTLFIPSNYHGEYPLSQYKEWVNELNSIEWLEIAAHGHYHMTSDPKRFGEMEFAELINSQDISDRITAMWLEWIAVETCPQGFRPPGWVVSNESHVLLNRSWNMLNGSDENGWFKSNPLYFKYVAIHYEHNHGLQWNCKSFFGHDGIQQENISIHKGDMIMYQSHIAGSHNHNVWNENNFNQLNLSLSHLFSQYEIEPRLLRECI